MTKLGLITSSSYHRLLYTSATKKDVFTPRRQISSTSSVWKDDQSQTPNASQSNTGTEKSSKDETVKSFDFSKGEITNKTSAAGSSGPRNLDEAKSLLQTQYELTRNQIGEKRDLARKQLDEKIESVRVIFGASPSKPRTPDEEWYYKRVSLSARIKPQLI